MGKMKLTVQKSVLIGIAILQCHLWIVLAQDAFKVINNKKEDDTDSSSDDKPKKTQESNERFFHSSLLFISSSLPTGSTSTVLSTSLNSLTSHSSQTSYFPGTAVLVDPESLLNSSIQDTFTDAISSHQMSYLATSHVVDVPTSYLLNSSYLLDSYYLLRNSIYLLENSSGHVSDTREFPSVSSLSVLKHIPASRSYDSYALVEGDQESVQSTVITESIIPTPSAESRILVLTSGYTSSVSVEFATHDDSGTSSTLPVIQSSQIPLFSSINSILNYETEDSSSVESGNSNFIASKPTISLSEKNNPDFSNFFIETHIGSTKGNPSIQSTNQLTLIQKETVPIKDAVSSKVPSASLNTASVYDSELRSVPAEAKEADDTMHSHEIITDDLSTKNKTFRNEDAEIDEIISGIIHLLAGNVQVVRPTKNAFGINPTRVHHPLPPTLISTRINNRGPIRQNSLSRTVVVFSQPPNRGHPPNELALAGQLIPSTLQNPQFIRIRPTKVGDHPPSAVSRIHFYKQGPKPPHPPPPPHIPFRGEIFNQNNRPLNNKIRVTTLPDEFVVPSFMDHEKQHVYNGNPGNNKYPHFIFSDDSASSVVVLLPSKPPKSEAFEKFSPEITKSENSNNKSIPSKKFEVLTDDSLRKKLTFSHTETPSLKFSENLSLQKVSSYMPVTSKFKISETKTKDETVPHGPVTDWVPFYERPSMKVRLNDTHTIAPDGNVSVILHPVIFDLTVSNSLNEVQNDQSLAIGQNSSTVRDIYSSFHIKTTKVQSSYSTILPETSKITPIPETEVLKTSSTFLPEFLSPSGSQIIESPAIEEIKITNVESPVTTTSKTTQFSKQNIEATHTSNKNRDWSTKVTTSLQKPDLRPSYSHGIGSFFTEKRAFVENTETAAFSTKYTTSTPVQIQSSTKTEIKSSSSQASDQTLLGRPIVIPVDIEEVRPFVGPINPSNQDRNRDNPYHGSYPGAKGSSSTEDPGRKSTPHTTTTRTPIIRSQARPRPNTVRIDTCIVGDDSTCEIALNETCKTELGISSCHCRPGFARSFARGPCIPIVSLMLSMKVDRLGSKKVAFSPKYLDKNSEEYRVMEFEAKVALTSLLSQIPAFSRTFLGMRVNTFYPIGEKLVVNSTVFLEEKESTRTQAVKLRLRQLIGEAIKNKQQNIGESRLYVEGTYSPITAIEDVNECSDANLNDCSDEGMCFNVFGTYICKCKAGYVDPFVHDERRSGRKCSACSPEYCSFHGKCFVERDKRLCKCHGNYIGSRCEIDGEVLGVALGASLAAIIIILLTLGCLCIWNRKWKQQQQKAEVLSSRSYNSNQTFSYVGNVMNANGNPYHLTMEDRMRWAQISDVIKNISVQPNPELPYLPPAMDQGAYANRCQPPNEEELSWYECRTRPRSRILGQYAGMPGPSCFEMDTSSRSHYASAGYHSAKRSKHASARY